MRTPNIFKNFRRPYNGSSSEMHNDVFPLSKANPGMYSEESITLHWNNICVKSKQNRSQWKQLFSKRTQNNSSRPILHQVSGVVRPGELLAIMGASGAGKTTLLNVLTFRGRKELEVDGTVSVNSQPIDATQFTAISAYVQQDDVFIGCLTVKEHLTFQALLRMDNQLSYSQRLQRVNEVIQELGLIPCQDTLIGIPGRIKGISGGEMRRLAFASEVLTDPPLMLCDEPTSGLDSFMAQNVVQLLRSMAAKGKTVVFTIHQPSSHLFDMFDRVLLLSEGRTAFLGEAKAAYDFFSRLKLPCPSNFNPADFYIQVLAVVPGDEHRCRQRIQFICNEYEKSESSLLKNGCAFQEFTESQCHSHQQFLMKRTPKSVYRASWCSQWRALLWRSVLTVIREPLLIKMRLVQTIVIAVLLGIVFWQQKLDDKGVSNINGALFLMLISVTFQNVFAVVNVFCTELPIFLREHWSGMYRTEVYFLSKTMAELPVFVVIPLIFTSISYWMIGMYPDVTKFLIACGIVTLTANAVGSFGYMISAVSSNITMALALSSPLIVPLMLFGGFFLNKQTVPWYLQWFQYVSWFTYGNEALFINQWQDVQHINCVMNKTCPRSGKVVLDVFGFKPENLSVDLLLLAVLFFAYRSVALMALYVRAKR